jgi:hypothetical protein
MEYRAPEAIHRDGECGRLHRHARFGGSRIGRAALAAAIGEINQDAREIGGNNRGPFVRKYFAPAGLGTGNS